MRVLPKATETLILLAVLPLLAGWSASTADPAPGKQIERTGPILSDETTVFVEDVRDRRDRDFATLSIEGLSSAVKTALAENGFTPVEIDSLAMIRLALDVSYMHATENESGRMRAKGIVDFIVTDACGQTTHTLRSTEELLFKPQGRRQVWQPKAEDRLLQLLAEEISGKTAELLRDNPPPCAWVIATGESRGDAPSDCYQSALSQALRAACEKIAPINVTARTTVVDFGAAEDTLSTASTGSVLHRILLDQQYDDSAGGCMVSIKVLVSRPAIR